MIISAHQPNYLPYLGFFDKMSKSDIFIIHNDVEFNRRDFQHRNKIRTFEGWKWLTVPVVKKEHIKINEVIINNEKEKNKAMWSNNHKLQIYANYKDTPFYESYKDDINKIYNNKYVYLHELNMELIKSLMKFFDINIELVYANTFGLETKSTQKLVDMVKELNGTTYLSGIGGYDYLDTSLFGSIEVIFQKFEHPIYPQRYEGFEPNMSALDALFNVGRIP
jgi:hypothetical protein